MINCGNTVTTALPIEIEDYVRVADECVHWIRKIGQAPKEKAVFATSQLCRRHTVPERLLQLPPLFTI